MNAFLIHVQHRDAQTGDVRSHETVCIGIGKSKCSKILPFPGDIEFALTCF
jgi:hypothetical protein